MRRVLLHVAVLVFFLSGALTVSRAQESASRIKPLHPQLGESIEPEENERYRIAGPVPGLILMRLHEFKRLSYRLHILYIERSQPRIRIVGLSATEKSRITVALDQRLQQGPGGLPDAADFLISLQPDPLDTSSVQEFVLYDGTTLHGTLIGIRGDKLIVRTSAGLEIPVPDPLLLDVRSMYGKIKQGRYRQLDPNQTRLFLAPTGRPLKKGTGYFADYYVVFPTLAYGVSENLSLSGGVSLIPGASSQLVYLAPRFAVQASPRLALAMGVLYLLVPNSGSASLGFAVATLGNAESASTFGFGVPLQGEMDTIIFLLGGELQVSDHLKLISENWLFGGRDTELLFSAGFRFFGRKLAVDLALIGSNEFFKGEGFPFVPWVDFSVFFGH